MIGYFIDGFASILSGGFRAMISTYGVYFRVVITER